MSGLCRFLREGAGGLTERVATIELADPFWQARYGERGRRFILEDGGHHLSYLAAALEGEAAALIRYAIWLRSVLVTRGMCSFHLERNFRLIAAELARIGADPSVRFAGEVPAALALLEQACAALRHTTAPAGPLDAAADGEAARRGPPTGVAGGVDPAQAERDLRGLLSYLADAAALVPTRFAAHVAWWRTYDAGRGVAPAYLDAQLDALTAIAGPLPGGAAALALIDGARREAA